MTIFKALFSRFRSDASQQATPLVQAAPLVIIDQIDSISFDTRTQDGLLNLSLVRTQLSNLHACAMNIHTVGYIPMQVNDIDFLLRSSFWCMTGSDEDDHMTGAEEIMSFDIKKNPQLRITPKAQLAIASEIIKRIQEQAYIENPYTVL